MSCTYANIVLVCLVCVCVCAYSYSIQFCELFSPIQLHQASSNMRRNANFINQALCPFTSISEHIWINHQILVDIVLSTDVMCTARLCFMAEMSKLHVSDQTDFVPFVHVYNCQRLSMSAHDNKTRSLIVNNNSSKYEHLNDIHECHMSYVISILLWRSV